MKLTDASFTDTYKLKGLRKKLVKILEDKYPFDSKILEVIGSLPRHYFFESAFGEQAYQDKAFPIGKGQTISQPYTVAYQTQLLEVKTGDKIMEIGTGSGYQAAVLVMLGAKVFSIERVPELHKTAKTIFAFLELSPRLYVGDGTLGLPKYAPFDKIIVTAAAPIIPETLVAQLKVGGYLVIPVGDKETQQMIRIIKTSETTTKKEVFDTFRFVPLIGEEGW
ncbi:MAG: protein-L-isoaspartate(D-aspartate) O-methyltransferase [Bacteroidetes bacterium]|nr:protein-L-isoaspartate(D-aspartate) O-methyltransferase [Bacteroidota bacterium]